MKLSAKLSVLFTTCSLLSLTACGGGTVKDTLGIGRKAPDEFRVVSRPPLSVPPQFNLRPPSANAESPTVVPADKQAQSIITGTAVKTKTSKNTKDDENTFDLKDGDADTAVTPVDSATLPSVATKKGDKKSASEKSSNESGFLKKIGADKADPTVRDTLVQQKIEAQEKQEEGSWWSNITATKDKKETLVNAKKEAERIQKNKAENKPVTEGETPEVKDKDRGVLGNIFGW
jgi:hypothetical protein